MSTTTPMMTPDQLRQRYLDFFAQRGHAVVPSSPLVPENDPTTLFTSSGMQPMMPYLLGAAHPKGARIVDSQKSFRSQDIEEVGDNRHTTFFEMLGNWSLGDYFKAEQLEWFFSFLVDEVGLNPSKLYVTVFRGLPNEGIPKDTEAVLIWKKLFSQRNIDAKDVDVPERDGMQDGRIFYYDEKKNWWSRAGAPQHMPIGEPGGPDSEVFYDFGAERLLHEQSAFRDEPCHVNCDCGRFLEIGNNVFMTYVRTDAGFEPLQQKNIDFGGGFERIMAAMQEDPDVFRTEIFRPIVEYIEQLSGKRYDESEKIQRAFRVIADHVRAATMLAGDGVVPSSKQQGYVARRLLRRAIRFGKTLGITKPWLADAADTVITFYQHSYPSMALQRAQICATLADEEQKFLRTLDKGLKEIEKLSQLTGENAFMLYETYGFPLELTQEIATERGQVVDQEAFAASFSAHKERSRSASSGTFKGGLADHSVVTTKYHTATHLLHAALRAQLGTHVQQKGSNITGERLRFDFSHTSPLTPEQLRSIEAQINAWIAADLPVTKQMMDKQTALESGAIAFFIEKYPDEVSVYTIGNDPVSDWISKELCGGPHVASTGEIGPVRITKEQSASAGIRRIYIQLES